MKQALILGCSHAIGAEMWMSPLSGLTQESSAEEKDGYGMTMCYPAIIARALGYQTNFRAVSGGSNDAMFRILEQSRIKPPDIVIACWTGGNRTEIFNDQDHTWVPLSVGHKTEGIYMEYMKQWIFWVNTGEQSRLNKLKNIYALNMLAQIRGIRVINIDSFWPVTNVKWDKETYWPVPDDFYRYVEDRGYPHTEWGHYYEAAHKDFADHVLRALANDPTWAVDMK